MGRKSFWSKAGSAVWKAVKWLAKGAWWIVAGLAKLVWSALKAAYNFLTGFAAGAAKKAGEGAARPKTGARAEAFKLVEAKSGDLGDFEDFLYEKKSTVGLILGARGSGKSALGVRILENAAARGRKVAAMGFSAAAMPSWVKIVETPEIENGSFLLVDEGGISFSSRSSMSSANKLLSELLFVARHKDLSVVFVTQNSANLEVNTLRQADYLLLKKPSLLQRDFERKKINEIYDEAAGGFKKHAADKGAFFVYSDAFRGFASNGLPSFWSEAASKSFKDVKLKG
ncbi:hypothetical protein COX86_01180 [Candidatus Micrarchaeota archaeon CG_4_10_14_0_2_um_filter_60_11]|nr:MAG: hypothetical protein AUJ16_01170 [Candidatus Micrarchaeota archaeon CG1_02_60_51]PIN96699.1 MAG: hypothetical protein COU39_00040 [Candidatus Micrarchaeota archaeon CG10_big_fil_rev_8_21_14_0_10_60_32]PIO01809.1 MAG: hypothetical protein COT58_03190 [Candidatus Micrarchaeota archaeon CG09_land_8_20_14_0_10_60_16]PIY92009.1 MAG: hypothetical protein COY71_00085 [Candidatus Micrarchaeota archaeon CG_4_10_14_0_8_um_filter_60_7]PIZ91150.1 MAG: hypothetical protein COX86_01180 [Candidatus Mi